jgi:hypothetical protein
MEIFRHHKACKYLEIDLTLTCLKLSHPLLLYPSPHPLPPPHPSLSLSLCPFVPHSPFSSTFIPPFLSLLVVNISLTLSTSLSLYIPPFYLPLYPLLPLILSLPPFLSLLKNNYGDIDILVSIFFMLF